MNDANPIAPWAFRAALSGLPTDEVRDILESERCPQPEPRQDHTVLDDEGIVVIVQDVERDGAWLRTEDPVDLEETR